MRPLLQSRCLQTWKANANPDVRTQSPQMTSSPDDTKRLGSPVQQVSASDDAAVTSKHVRDSFRTLARQIVVLLRTVLLNAGKRSKACRLDARAAIKASAEAFGSRWPRLRNDLVLKSTDVVRSSADVKSRFEVWRNKSGLLSKVHRAKPGRRHFAAAFALALALCADS